MEKVKCVDKALLKYIAQPSWRGIAISDLVILFQDGKGELERVLDTPELFAIPKDFDMSHEEYTDSLRYYFTCFCAGIVTEFKRRAALPITCPGMPESQIIQTIKDRLPIENVIEWYCEVFHNTRDQWKFRCTLHGDGVDKTPSGCIYLKEARFHCYVCNKGGDIFDAIQVFDKIDLSSAIAKAARYLGIDTKPLIRKPIPQVKGGATL